MSRCGNATDLRQELCQIDDISEVQVPDLVGNEPKDTAQRYKWLEQKALLEEHSRVYVIDRILYALNWALSPYDTFGTYIQNLAPEVGVPSRSKGTRLFLDYLGYQHESKKPLLVVEAKRNSLSLPCDGEQDNSHPRLHDAATAFAEYLSSKETDLTKEWQEYLDDLKEYVLSLTATNATPQRIVLTNGDWLIVFSNPAAVFLAENDVDTSLIIVFRSREAMIDHADLLFELLDYGQLALNAGELEPEQLPFYVDSKAIASVSHALNLAYVHEPRIYESTPRISVAPILLLLSSANTLIRVRLGKERVIPTEDAKMDSHLSDISTLAQSLLAKVRLALQRQDLAAMSIEGYFNGPYFPQYKGVRVLEQHRGEIRLIIVTGAQSHFLVPNREWDMCRFHEHSSSLAENHASCRHAISSPSIPDQSFFVDGSKYHCTHRGITNVKSAQLNAGNRNLCGPRSANDTEAFCEIWLFEKLLCCRRCVFQNLCLAAQVFVSPPCEQSLIQLQVASQV